MSSAATAARRSPPWSGSRSSPPYEPGIIGPFRKYLRRLAGYSSSYYWDRVRPGRKHKGTRCEDLQALTFADDSFDLAISDIFEHIREPFRAFEELRRVLKPGGRHIFRVSGRSRGIPAPVSRR